MNTRIDGAAVLQRRLDLGLSRNQLADMLSIRARLLARIESDEAHLAALLTADQFLNLANALGTTPAALLASTSPQPAPRAAPTDAATLTTLIAQTSRPLSQNAVCRALDWTLDRVHCATAETNVALAAVGLTITRRGQHLRLVGTDPAGCDAAADVTVEQTQADGMPTSTVRVLDLVHAGRLTSQNGRVAPETRSSLGFLQRTGLIRVDHERITTTDAFRFAFPDLDEPDLHAAAPTRTDAQTPALPPPPGAQEGPYRGRRTRHEQTRR